MSRSLIAGCLAVCLVSPAKPISAQEIAAPADDAAVVADDADSTDSPAGSPASEDSDSTASPSDAPVGASAADTGDAAPAASARGTDVSDAEAVRILMDQLPPENSNLRFNFTGASWKDVLDWLAEEGNLSLQIDRYPAGTVSFVDRTRTYSVPEALDLLNRLLLDRGYALVKRGRTLFFIDLEAENADKLISEFAELVQPEDLEKRGKSDIVTSIFPLGSMSPEEAKVQLPQMIGPWGRVIVLDSARQAKVTERAEKLIGIRNVITQSAQEVHEIKLQHRSAEELLQTARPLLGLEPGENASDEIRIAVGLYGDRIYATGVPAKVSVLENLIAKADQAIEGSGDDADAEVVQPLFQTHIVRSADPASVFDVLQTLLQDEPGTRVAIDPSTNAIIALATPATHKKIDEVILKMEGSGEGFEVFQLKRIDPAQALLTINKYFGVTEENAAGPIVDGDPATGKLWVRGSADEIDQIRKLLEQLDGTGGPGLFSGKVRLLPLTGRQAEDALQQLQLYWRLTGRENAIRLVRPSGTTGESRNNNGIRERKIIRPLEEQGRSPMPSTQPPVSPAGDLDASLLNPRKTYYLIQAPVRTTQTGQTDSRDGDRIEKDGTVPVGATSAKPDIMIELTPNGLRIASDDTEALDELEELLSQLTGPSAVASDLPTIFWLKYIKADIASELIASILGGGDSGGSLTDTITGGLGGGMLGGLMGLAGGGGGESAGQSVLTSTGSVNIVPDLRLNALFVQANEVDLQVIEMVLEKIDRSESPEDIELTASPRMIPVYYQDAEEIAKVVKEVYADRMGGAQSSQGGGRGGGGGGGQQSPQEMIAAAIRGGRGGRGGGAETAKSERSKIIIAVDTQSNALVVTAEPQDYEEIRMLVETLDESGKVNETTTLVVPVPGGMNPDSIVQALEAVLGRAVETKDASSGQGGGSSAGGAQGGASSTEAADAFRQRMEAFRSRLGGGGGGGGPFGGGGGGRGAGGAGGRGGGGGPFGGGGGGGPGGGGRGGRPGGR